MTVVPTEPGGRTNALSTSSPLYYITRECSSTSLSSPSAQKAMENCSNSRLTNSTYGNDNRVDLSCFERKRKMAVVHQRQKTQLPYHHQLPERLLPLVTGQEDLRKSHVMAKWVAEFLPKPEPPRFFRPLCARLSRQQQRLREEHAMSESRCVARMEEVRLRLALSVSEVRAEQKAALRELRQQRKRGGGEQQKREQNGGEQPQRRNGTEGEEQTEDALCLNYSTNRFIFTICEPH